MNNINKNKLPPITSITKDTDLSTYNIFDAIFDIIKDMANDKDQIDLICKMYLNGELGNPSSLENIGRFNPLHF